MPTSGNGVPSILPISSVDITEKLGSTNPLVQALNSSKASLQEAERVREALEAEAQEVAQVRLRAWVGGDSRPVCPSRYRVAGYVTWDLTQDVGCWVRQRCCEVGTRCR